MARQQTPSIALVHAIVCDDIRREDNGKFILIGVYPELILLNRIPAQITLSLWLQFRVHIISKTTLEFEIRGSAIEKEMPFSLDIDDPKIFGKEESIPLIIKLPFAIKEIGNFTIFYRKKGDRDWNSAQTIQINRNNILNNSQTLQ